MQLDQTGNIMGLAILSAMPVKLTQILLVPTHLLPNGGQTRDTQTENRLETYGTRGVWGCTRCFTAIHCPMGVAPLDQINKIKQEIPGSSRQPNSTARYWWS